MTRLIAPLAIGCILSYAFDGLLRWLLNLGHVSFLVYLRDAAQLWIIAYCFVAHAAARRRISGLLSVFWLVAMGVVIAGISGLKLPQCLFGFKILLPLVTGFVLAECGYSAALHRPRFWGMVFLLLVAGILIQRHVALPWTGLVVEVGDYSVVANRQWTQQGIARLSGFSRTSFDAATYLLLLACYLVCYARPLAVRFLVVAGAMLAIALTTTKGAFAALALVVIMSPLVFIGRKGPARRAGLVACVLGIAVLGAALPLFSSQIEFPNLPLGSIERRLFYSVLERAWSTWPKAFALPEGWQFALGRGLGGIGVAQSLFETIRYNPADNLFVYCYVTAGLVGVAGYLLPAIGICRLPLSAIEQKLMFLVVLSVYTYGLTVNVIESTPMAAVLGCILAKTMSGRDPLERREEIRVDLLRPAERAAAARRHYPSSLAARHSA